jgi:hypothetical protein
VARVLRHIGFVKFVIAGRKVVKNILLIMRERRGEPLRFVLVPRIIVRDLVSTVIILLCLIVVRL